MFSGMINNFKLSQVAVVVQNLLEMHGQGGAVARNAAMIANKLVTQTWDQDRAFYDGRSGKRPHKLTFAAAALALGVERSKDDRDVQLCLITALGTVLLEITGKPQDYALTTNDHAILGVAQEVYLANAD